MATTRRQFIKRSATAVTVSLVMPRLWIGNALAQSPQDRRILVVIQLAGGNDWLNTLVPYTDSTYRTLRPTIGFAESELKDAQGHSTIISSSFGLHPGLTEIKSLYDAGRVAIVNGVGYPSPNLSHFLSMDIWQTANTNGGVGNGWLGKYADQKLVGQSGLSAVSIGGSLPKALFSDKVVVPSISNFQNYQFLTDPRNTGDRNNQINTFNQNSNRSFDDGSFIKEIAATGIDALAGAQRVQQSVGTYTSPVTYPSGNGLANALKMVAQLATTVSEANLFYVQMGGFDHHSDEIGNAQSPTDKTVGQHMNLLSQFSQAVKAFYDDMASHGLADKLLMMHWSEFGRRPGENASFGTDHGTSSGQLIIGDPVVGGIYGQQPSLTDLDGAGNLKFKVDFRAVYATVLDKWLSADSQSILGASFENVGFLG
jgi:uncharacterized protein (DUF1501 family)